MLHTFLWTTMVVGMAVVAYWLWSDEDDPDGESRTDRLRPRQ